MSDELPLTQVYNLARLGQAGDEIQLAATPEECTAIARWSSITAVEQFAARVGIKKVSSSTFALDVTLTADVVQACVVSLEPVPARIERHFTRELHFSGPARRGLKTSESDPVTITLADDDEAPEEIESLHYDLARPVLEEYVLSLDPYPRVKGAEFGEEAPPADKPESPFAALKALKSSP